MPRKAAPADPAILYLDAVDKLEQSASACEKAAAMCRKAYRLLKKVEVARNATDPKPPAA